MNKTKSIRYGFWKHVSFTIDVKNLQLCKKELIFTQVTNALAFQASKICHKIGLIINHQTVVYKFMKRCSNIRMRHSPVLYEFTSLPANLDKENELKFSRNQNVF